MAAADVIRQAPGDDTLAVTRARVEEWLRARNVEPAFYLDTQTGGGQVFSAQTPGELLAWPETVMWFLFHEGAHVFLDGGQLDVGLVRSPELNATNDHEYFAESFEATAHVGHESLAVTSTVCPSGASQAAIDEVALACGEGGGGS